MNDFPLLWIPLLPLLGAAFNLTLGQRSSRRAVHLVACGVVLGALLISLQAVFSAQSGLWAQVWSWQPGQSIPALTQQLYPWIYAGPLEVDLGLRCDPLTAVMLIVVTFVGLLIHIYSTGYMQHEPDYARFFGYMNLFTSAMLILVLADNLVVMFVGWEGVGLCSYLLIGFWYDRDGPTNWGIANAAAGRKAFIVNRIGDFAFILGMLVLYAGTGTLNFEQMAAQESGLVTFDFVRGFGPYSVATIAALLLFIGATGKSAQIPLFVWLPDAMAGPTPVSALIHAATMVTAGIYMITRLSFVYLLAPWVMGLVALVGAVTALFAASIAFAQNDIKKVLAYSTISQLGYMFMAVGVGAFSAGVFHLFTHAFFKACLFLCAGAVIHAMHDEQDIRKMGGLRRKLPVTHWTFLISTLAIAGIPPLSGFFSKDEILWKSLATGNTAFGPNWLPPTLYVLGMAGALCTAFYMFRLYGLTFLGAPRGSDRGETAVHAPGTAMRVPLIVLAVFAALVGPLALPGLFGDVNLFHHWLAPVVHRGGVLAASVPWLDRVGDNGLAANHALEGGLMLLSVVVAAVSSAVALRAYRDGTGRWVQRFVARLPRLYRVIAAKYWIDEIFRALFVRPFAILAKLLFNVADKGAIDTVGVRGSAWTVDTLGRFVRSLHSGNVQHYVVALVIGICVLIYWSSVPPDQFTITPGPMVEVGQQVTFDATPAGSGTGQKLQYRWDFDGDGQWDHPVGDDAWSFQAVVQHTYQAPRDYRVIVRVRDPRWHTQNQRIETIVVTDHDASTGGQR